MLNDEDHGVDVSRQVRDDRAERLDATGRRTNDYNIVTALAARVTVLIWHHAVSHYNQVR